MHEHVLRRTGGVGHRCDICRADSQEFFYNCTKCDYDCCLSCLQKEAEKHVHDAVDEKAIGLGGKKSFEFVWPDGEVQVLEGFDAKAGIAKWNTLR